MEYRKLGRTGLKVSALCMGTMQFGWTSDEAAAYQVLSAAVDDGLNFIDTADIYSRWVEGNPGGVSEEIVGRWIKHANIPRDKLVIATKVRGEMGAGVNDQGLSRAHIMQAVDASLRRLQIDYIDLYQAHWADDDTPIEETLRAFDDLVKAGKVRYIGSSNYAVWQMMEALWTSDTFGLARFDSIQPHYNMLHRAEFEYDNRAMCEKFGIGVIPYSPLAGGFLSGKYRKDTVVQSGRADGRKKYFTDQNWALLDTMDVIARAHNGTTAQIALAWMLADPIITSPIIGANTVEQWKDNLGAVNFKLSADEKKILDDLTTFPRYDD
jgi:aryl-alcohol dehydrogenase-like predicted oxidoreductase